MLKKIFIATSIALAVTNLYAEPQSSPILVYLKIKNTTSPVVRVEEGYYIKTDVKIDSGFEKVLKMYGGMTNLTIYSESKLGGWEPIPGCPKGNFSESLNVTVYKNVIGELACLW